MPSFAMIGTMVSAATGSAVAFGLRGDVGDLEFLRAAVVYARENFVWIDATALPRRC